MQQMDKRFEQVDKRFLALQWFMGIGFGLIMSTLGLAQINVIELAHRTWHILADGSLKPPPNTK